MDEELKKLLDEAHAAGANEQQLDNIVNLYQAKKKNTDQSAIVPPVSDGSPPVSDGQPATTSIIPAGSTGPNSTAQLINDQTKQKPFDPFEVPKTEEKIPDLIHPFKSGPSFGDLVEHSRKDDQDWQALKVRQQTLDGVIGRYASNPNIDPADVKKLQQVSQQLVPAPPADKSVNYNSGWQKFTDKVASGWNGTWGFLYDDVVLPINQGLNDLVYKPIAGANDLLDRAINGSYHAITGSDAPEWLRKGKYLDDLSKNVEDQYNEAHKDDNIAEGVITGVSQTVPIAASMFTGEGEISLATQAYKGVSNLVKTLSVTHALSSFKQATDDGLDFNDSVGRTVVGGAEGAVSGMTMEAQMLVGGALGKGVANKLAQYGLLKGNFSPALINALAVGSVFGGTDVMQDVADGKEVDWDKATKSFGTGMAFEVPGIIQAGGKDFVDHIQNKKLNDRAASAAVAATGAQQLNDAAMIRNLSGFSPEQIAEINKSAISSDDLYAQSIQKGMEAYEAKTPEEKNALHMQQLSLKNQADIKKVTERIISNKDGFLVGLAKADIPEDMKLDLLSKVSTISKAHDPIEIEKASIGDNITKLNGDVTNYQDAMANAGNDADKNTHLVALNDAIGKRTELQQRLFDISQNQSRDIDGEIKSTFNRAKLEDNLIDAHTSVEHRPETSVNYEHWHGYYRDATGTPHSFTGDTEAEARKKIDEHFDERFKEMDKTQDEPAPAGVEVEPVAETQPPVIDPAEAKRKDLHQRRDAINKLLADEPTAKNKKILDKRLKLINDELEPPKTEEAVSLPESVRSKIDPLDEKIEGLNRMLADQPNDKNKATIENTLNRVNADRDKIDVLNEKIGGLKKLLGESPTEKNKQVLQKRLDKAIIDRDIILKSHEAAPVETHQVEAEPVANTGDVSEIPVKVSNENIGDAEIIRMLPDGGVTLKMDDGSIEDLPAGDLLHAGIQDSDIKAFKDANGIAEPAADAGPYEKDTATRISDLREKLKNKDAEFTEAEVKLFQLHPEAFPEGQVSESKSRTKPAGRKLDEQEKQQVKQSMTAIFPKIKAEYYDTASEFNAAWERLTGRPLADDAIVHAFVDSNKVIHFNPEHMKADTQLHEQGHILTNWAYHYSPALYDAMMRAGSKMDKMHDILRYNGYDAKGTQLYDESFVTALGREAAGKIDELGKTPAERTLVTKLIQNAYNKFERWLVAKTGFSIKNKKDVRNMEIKDLVDYVNKEYLLSGRKISDISSEELAAKDNDGDIFASKKKAGGSPPQSTARPVRKKGEALSDYIDRVRDWHKDNDPNFGKPVPVVDAPDPAWSVEDETVKERLGRRWQDYLNRAAKVQKAIEASGGTINERTDFYTSADLQGAKAAQHQRELYEQIVKSPDKKNPALFERMHEAGIQKADFDSFMRAKHVEEYNTAVGNRRRASYEAEFNRLEEKRKDAVDNANKSSERYYNNAIADLVAQKNKKYPLMDDGAAGMTNAEANQILDDFKKSGKITELEKFGDEFIREVSNKDLDVRLDSGMIDQETYDNLKSQYKNYVSFQVQDYLNEKDSKGTDKPLKRNSGSAFNKVDNLLRKAKGSTERTADQRVSPSSMGVVQLEKAYIEAEKNKTLNVLYNQVEQNPNDSVYEIVHPKYAPTYRRDGSVAGFREITDPKVVKNAAQLYRNGKKVYIDIKDPILKRAILKEGIVPTIKALDAVNNYLRQVNTLKSPVFWVTNAVKDFQTAGFNISTEDQKGLGLKMAKGVLPAMKAVFQFEHGSKRTGEWADTYDRYLKSGGKTTVIKPDTDIGKIRSIEKIIDNIGKKKNLVQTTKAFVDWVSTFGEATELGTRLSVFKAGLDVGMTDQQAAVLSRNATINFNKKGEWSGIAGNMYLMFNGGMQGKLYLAKKLATSPLARKIYGGMVVAGYMSAALNHNASDPDDEKNNYGSLSEFEKQNNFVLKNPIGDGFFKIPAGHGLNLPYYLGTQMYEMIHGSASPGTAGLNTALVGFNSFSPIAGADWFQTLVPTEPLRYGAQFAENKNAFGTPVYKETKFGPATPDSHTHFAHTDPIMVKLAQGLNSLTGGTGVKSGLIDLSPDVLEWMVSTGGGGLGRTVEQTPGAVVDLGEHAAQKIGFMPESVKLTPLDVSKIPFLSKFYAEGKETNWKAIIYQTLHDSGNNEIGAPETTKFYDAVFHSLAKGELTKQQYKQLTKQFVDNQIRISFGDIQPDLEKSDIDLEMKHKKTIKR